MMERDCVGVGVRVFFNVCLMEFTTFFLLSPLLVDLVKLFCLGPDESRNTFHHVSLL